MKYTSFSGTKICFLKFLLSFTFVSSVRNYLPVLFLVFETMFKQKKNTYNFSNGRFCVRISQPTRR